eukprot:7381703-Prymnesium_polylepis.2
MRAQNPAHEHQARSLRVSSEQTQGYRPSIIIRKVGTRRYVTYGLGSARPSHVARSRHVGSSGGPLCRSTVPTQGNLKRKVKQRATGRAGGARPGLFQPHAH